MNQIPDSKPSIEPVQQLPLDKYLREIYPYFFSEELSDWVSVLLLRKAVTPVNNCSISISQYNTRSKNEQRLHTLNDKRFFHARVVLNAIEERGRRLLNLSRATQNFDNLAEYEGSARTRVSNRFLSIYTNFNKVDTRLNCHLKFRDRYDKEIDLLNYQLQNLVKSTDLLSFFNDPATNNFNTFV